MTYKGSRRDTFWVAIASFALRRCTKGYRERVARVVARGMEGER